MAPAILPFASIGGTERRLCAVFSLDDGATLALQATCIMGVEPHVTVFVTTQGADLGAWSMARAVAINLPIQSALSLTIAPVLMRGGKDYAVAWALEVGGILVVTANGAVVEELPLMGHVVAIGAGDQGLSVAVQRKESERTEVLVQTAAGWSDVAAGPLAPANGPVTAVAVFAGHVYAARSNPVQGFDLVRADLESKGDWTPVITNGGWRHGYNRAVSAMAVVGGRLIVAADGPDTTLVYVGDEHPEIFAVDADGKWALVSGQARFTPQGLYRPETMGGPGTPDFKGLTIGGLQAHGKDMVMWLKPRGATDDLAVISHWSASSGAWTVLETMQMSDACVTSMALTADGTFLVGCAAEGNPVDVKDDILALSGSKSLLLVQKP